MYSLSTGLNEVPSFVYDNSAWFIYYSNLFDMDRIKSANRSKGKPAKRMLGGAALAAAMKNL